MSADNRPIGIFDSGLGGLTVVAELRKEMPNENIVYLGDTARVPYGDKSPESIAKFAIQDTKFLLDNGVKAIIVACNTVSAVAIDKIYKVFSEIPLFGVLEAGIRACIAENPSSVVIIGTRATIASDSYRKGIHKINPSINVVSIPTPLLVPIVEEGLQDSKISEMVLQHYLGGILQNPPDILLLACTHYPLLRNKLKQILPEKVKIIDSAESCAKFAAEKLYARGLNASPNQRGVEKFFVSDMPGNFYQQAKRFFARDLEHFEKVSFP